MFAYVKLMILVCFYCKGTHKNTILVVRHAEAARSIMQHALRNILMSITAIEVLQCLFAEDLRAVSFNSRVSQNIHNDAT